MEKAMPQSRGARHKARVFVLLGLYQWLADPALDYAAIDAHLEGLIQDEEGAALEECDIDPRDFARCDKALFAELLGGVLNEQVQVLDFLR